MSEVIIIGDNNIQSLMGLISASMDISVLVIDDPLYVPEMPHVKFDINCLPAPIEYEVLDKPKNPFAPIPPWDRRYKRKK